MPVFLVAMGYSPMQTGTASKEVSMEITLMA
jgi:hypothetical protein